MRLLRDIHGIPIRLTEERLAHILQHPEVAGLMDMLSETLRRPYRIVASYSDPDARLYYRYVSRAGVGEKYLCVVVKVLPTDAFVLTAYITDKIKRGDLLWPTEN